MTQAHQKNTTGKTKPFTLIELLLIITIIVILCSILLPALSSVRVTAKRITCMSQMRQMGMANFQYITNNSGYNVPSTYNTYYPANSYSNKCWYSFLGELMNYQYFNYPALALPRPSKPSSFAAAYTQIANSVFMCPAGFLGGNGENFFYQALNYGLTSGSIGGAVTNVGLRITQVKRPSIRAFLFDTGTYNFFVPGAGQDPATLAAIGTHVYVASGPTQGQKNQNLDFFVGRHRYTVNILYYDGHTENLPSLSVNRHHRNISIPIDENMFQVTR